MRSSFGVLLLGVVACSSGTSDLRDAGDRPDAALPDTGPQDTGIVPDASADGGTRDAAEPDPCRIDLTLAGPPEISGPFVAEDFPPEAGWVDMTVSFRGVFGPVSAPLTSCDLAGPLAVAASGRDRTDSDDVTFTFGLEGYAGPGNDTRSFGDGLTLSLTHSDLGDFSPDGDTRCQVCVEADGRRGLFRCTRMLNGAASLEIHRGAFACP